MSSQRRYIVATRAEHVLGDISRDEPDFAVIYGETEADYIGHWLTGFGYIDVRFPKLTSRPVTDRELAWIAAHPVVIA